jgi:hypothetical protein
LEGGVVVIAGSKSFVTVYIDGEELKGCACRVICLPSVISNYLQVESVFDDVIFFKIHVAQGDFPFDGISFVIDIDTAKLVNRI